MGAKAERAPRRHRLRPLIPVVDVDAHEVGPPDRADRVAGPGQRDGQPPVTGERGPGQRLGRAVDLQGECAGLAGLGVWALLAQLSLGPTGRIFVWTARDDSRRRAMALLR